MAKKVEIPVSERLAITPDEAAAMLSTGLATINKLVDEKHLPCMKIGSDRKIWLADLADLRGKMKNKQFDLQTLELKDI